MSDDVRGSQRKRRIRTENFDLGDAYHVTCIFGHQVRVFNLGQDHFAGCDECRTFMWLGANVWSSWRQQNHAFWQGNWRSVRGYRLVPGPHHWTEEDLEELFGTDLEKQP